MTQSTIRVIFAAMLALALASPLPAMADNDSSAPAMSTVVPPGQVFSCGAGFTFTSVGITTHGNVLSFQSPAGNEHLNAFLLENGYQVCRAPFLGAFVSVGFDIASSESAWGATPPCSQPNGPGTFPLECTRTTADGSLTITRRITGNSFVAPTFAGGGFDSFNANGVGCDHLEECGNCTNRTIHVLTRILNNTGVLQTVRYVEYADVDISSFGSIPREFASRTNDSTQIFSTPNDANPGNHGILMQALSIPATTAILPFVGSTGAFPIPSATCDVPTVVTPTGFGDFVAAVRHEVTLPPGGSSGNNIRLHYRRY